MKVDKSAMLLYAVTDRMWLGENSLACQVEKAIQAGATFIQLREKNLDFDSFLALAREIKVITDRYRVPYVINDNIDIALACDADGVHVGQHDMAACDVRTRIGREKILGVSVQTAEQAVPAQKSGADYLGVGSVFATSTKPDADYVPYDTLQEICAAVSIPVVAIGGIHKDNVLSLSGSGADGIAVVSAIFAQKDIPGAVRELRRLSSEMVNSPMRGV